VKIPSVNDLELVTPEEAEIFFPGCCAIWRKFRNQKFLQQLEFTAQGVISSNSFNPVLGIVQNELWLITGTNAWHWEHGWERTEAPKYEF
jgi:hypothetical protein